jgi:hypothetical protein
MNSAYLEDGLRDRLGDLLSDLLRLREKANIIKTSNESFAEITSNDVYSPIAPIVFSSAIKILLSPWFERPIFG